MRQKLNENPVYQLIAVGILLLGGGFMLSTRVLGGSSENGAASPAATATPATDPAAAAGAGVLPAGSSAAAAVPAAPISIGSIPAPPLPPKVIQAHERGDLIALLVVRGGGIDDRLVAPVVRNLSRDEGVATFVITANHIARYAAIAGAVGVNRVPALVIVAPKGTGAGASSATVEYGFQSPESIAQAVRDATYHGPVVGYPPG